MKLKWPVGERNSLRAASRNTCVFFKRQSRIRAEADKLLQEFIPLTPHQGPFAILCGPQVSLEASEGMGSTPPGFPGRPTNLLTFIPSERFTQSQLALLFRLPGDSARARPDWFQDVSTSTCRRFLRTSADAAQPVLADCPRGSRDRLMLLAVIQPMLVAGGRRHLHRGPGFGGSGYWRHPSSSWATSSRFIPHG